MMIYKVEYVRSALKEIKKLPPDIRIRIQKAILNLTTDPRKGNVRPMVGSSAWRLSVVDYRVVYDIKDSMVVILILKIKHIMDIYKR